jgi:hypothetical protein
MRVRGVWGEVKPRQELVDLVVIEGKAVVIWHGREMRWM